MNKYSKNAQWKLGDVITPQQLNDISNTLKQATEELDNAINNTIDGAHTLNDRINNLIALSDTQPTTQGSKIWFDTSQQNPIELCQKSELDAVLLRLQEIENRLTILENAIINE